MQNTPDRHPARFSGPAPVRFPGRMRHNKHVTATRPLQRNFAAAFRITPNAGCVPGTGGCPDAVRGGTGRMGRHGKFGEGSDKKAAGRATGTAQEQPGRQKEQRQEQQWEQNGNNARPAETAERTTPETAAGQDRNSSGARREQRRKQQQGERKKANYSEKSGAVLTIRKQHSQKILIIRPLSNRNQIHKSGNK